jgi:hypothetical protein
VRSVLDKQV